MANSSTICLSSFYSMQLNQHRNNGSAKEKMICGLGKTALLVTAAAETASFGSLAIFSIIYYPKSNKPFNYLSQKFSSAHFTVYRNVADLLLNFSTGNFPTTEADARREFDQSIYCTLVKAVIAATNAYLITNAISLVFAASTLATLLKINLSAGYFYCMIKHRFSPDAENYAFSQELEAIAAESPSPLSPLPLRRCTGHSAFSSDAENNAFSQELEEARAAGLPSPLPPIPRRRCAGHSAFSSDAENNAFSQELEEARAAGFPSPLAPLPLRRCTGHFPLNSPISQRRGIFDDEGNSPPPQMLSLDNNQSRWEAYLFNDYEPASGPIPSMLSLNRAESQWQATPEEALDPQAGPAIERLSENNRRLGINFLRNEIFGKIDRATATALFEEFDTESANYILALTSYIYVFGSKRNDPLPSFLKPESLNHIIALRYAFEGESTRAIPSDLSQQLRQKIQNLRALDEEDVNHAKRVLRNFIISNPEAENREQRFLNIENYKKDRPADGDSVAVRNFFENETAVRILNELKLATSSDLANSDFITVCYPRAMPQDQE